MGKPSDGSAERYLKCMVYNKNKKDLAINDVCVGFSPL